MNVGVIVTAMVADIYECYRCTRQRPTNGSCCGGRWRDADRRSPSQKGSTSAVPLLRSAQSPLSG